MPREDLPNIDTRRELFDYLEQQMNRSYRQVLDTGVLLSDRPFLKSFIFEFDWDPANLGKSEVEYLQESLTIPSGNASRHSSPPSIKETDEAGFFQVQWHWRRGRPTLLYLDTASDPQRRFWLGYSLTDATDLNVVVERLAQRVPAFDRAWLWPSFLEATQDRGEFRGIGLDYDYRRFENKEGVADSTNYFKVQIWGGPGTREILKFIGDHRDFRGRTVLAKVRMKYWDDCDERDRFALEDIKYNGKFLSRGTSFNSHQALLSETRNLYADKIRSIESQHIIRAVDEAGGGLVDGDPVFFEFTGHPIENLDAFCEVVFSGHMPFRLWGTPREIPGRDEGRAVSAVDLHTGSKLFFEVYHDIVCMYLYPGACGNTVARFFTNLQHTFSRLVAAKDNEDQDVL